MRVSLWERAGGYFRGWGPGGDDPDAAFERGRCLLDGVESDVAAVEVGGGPWETDWVGAAEMKEPLGTLAAADVDPRAVEMFFEPVFGEGWVPGGL
jgi:methyltransferase-like protein 6/tocopherol cyclase